MSNRTALFVDGPMFGTVRQVDGPTVHAYVPPEARSLTAAEVDGVQMPEPEKVTYTDRGPMNIGRPGGRFVVVHVYSASDLAPITNAIEAARKAGLL